MSTKAMGRVGIATAVTAIVVAGCDGGRGPLVLEPTVVSSQLIVAPPPGLVPVTADGTVTIWPYTGTSFAGVPQDPINLIFVGQADPRNVRNALFSVDGTRSGDLAPFTCTWKDAIGGQQTAYSGAADWSGSVIQLECGDYVPFRFHIRLFPAGAWTLANAHVDVLIPGTTDHQVLSWEIGEQLVTYDLLRSGLLTGAPGSAPGINAAPTFRTIIPQIYNSLPPPLRALTGGPLFGMVAVPVGIPTDGSATVLSLRDAPPAAGSEQDFVVPFGQIIPKPFCDAGGELLRVDGPVRLRQEVRVTASGVLTSQTFADGELVVRSVDPITGAIGAPQPATVRDHYHTHAGGGTASVFSTREQTVRTGPASEQALEQHLQVGPRGQTRYRSEARC
jgi:hypothetical protein